jgi:acetate kinase
LHNEPALSAIRAARAVLGLAVPQVAVFDTAFHRTLPERTAKYAIPMGLAEKHNIRRYGFHGGTSIHDRTICCNHCSADRTDKACHTATR